jgi:hypothetical protein
MGAASNQPHDQRLASVPAWAKSAPTTGETDAAFQAGATLGALDARIRADARIGAVWRRRLALTAAAASAQLIRRGEDEAMLRDAFCLRQGNADPGPAGRLLIAWRDLDRGLGIRSTPLDHDVIARVASLFGLRADDALTATIAGVQEIARAKEAAPVAAARAATYVAEQRPAAELLALWLADAVLAARLTWPQPLPLLAGALVQRALRHQPALAKAGERRPRPTDANWIARCCAAYALAAAQACDLFDKLAERSRQLIAIERRLRAKGATAVIDKLHDEDAVSPPAFARAGSDRIGTMSDRAMRRLFDRLVSLGAVRELTGRSTFRLYGL